MGPAIRGFLSRHRRPLGSTFDPASVSAQVVSRVGGVTVY